jgi:hypothetical protein
MIGTRLMSVAPSCACDSTDLDRLAASLEAIALTFGHSDAKQNRKRQVEGQRRTSTRLRWPPKGRRPEHVNARWANAESALAIGAPRARLTAWVRLAST